MSDQNAPILIYATFPNPEEARLLARQLIESRLGACVNILPEMTSFYEWDGELVEEGEVVMLVKTTKERQEKLVAFICETHSYDEPAVIVLPVVGGSAGYLSWVAGSGTA